MTTNLEPLVPPYSALFEVDEAGDLSLLVLAPPHELPPTEPNPEPPVIDWPPGNITELPSGVGGQQLQNAIDAAPAGGSVRLKAGTLDLGRQSIRLKNGVVVHAAGKVSVLNAPGPGTAGAFDGSGRNDWAITGDSPDSGGFDLTALVNASGASNFAIANVDFHNMPSNGFDGSAIRLGGARQGLLLNCDFWSVEGNVVGMYNLDAITCDGLHFASCTQPVSIQLPQSADHNWGNHLHFLRCAFEKTGRAAIEIGPSSAGAEYTNDLRVEDCWFADFELKHGAHEMLPISLVAQAGVATSVKRNFIDRGMGSASGTANPGIEFTGSGVCCDNVIKNHAWAGFMYQSGWEIYGNVYWVAPGQPRYSDRADGWTNNGSGTGSVHDNQTPSAEPVRPPKPARVDASVYYPTLLRRRFRAMRG
jgi:hypothetical protein